MKVIIEYDDWKESEKIVETYEDVKNIYFNSNLVSFDAPKDHLILELKESIKFIRYREIQKIEIFGL